MFLTKKKDLGVIWMQESLSVDPRIVQDFVVAPDFVQDTKIPSTEIYSFFFCEST